MAIPPENPFEFIKVLREIRLLIESGVLEDKTRITVEVQRSLLPLVARAEALCQNPATIEYDLRLASLRLAIAMGEAGFYS